MKTPPIHITAGPQRISAAFIQRFDGPVDDLLVPLENTLADVNISFGVTALPHMRDMTILGPSAVTGVSDTISRRMIFTCRPTSAREEETCAAEIVKGLTARAYPRRPARRTTCRTRWRSTRRGARPGDFESGIRMALQSVLMSPRFLFRLEQAPEPVVGQDRVGLPAQRSGSRLASVVLPLGHGARRRPAEGRERRRAAHAARAREAGPPHARRPRARRRCRPGSPAQWLRLQDLEKIHPDYLLFPQYDDTLAQAMLQGDRAVLRQHRPRGSPRARPADRRLHASSTSGSPSTTASPTSPAARSGACRLPEYRRGLLGQGSILTLTSVADRTSPVLRGKWVMEVLLGTPPPPPPPNVPALDDTKAATAARTLTHARAHGRAPQEPGVHLVPPRHRPARARRSRTSTRPARGASRTTRCAVDSVGDLYDGTKMDGPGGAARGDAEAPDVFLLSFTENLMTYALGRRVEYTDMPAVRAIIRDAAQSDNRHLGVRPRRRQQRGVPDGEARHPCS